MTSQPRHLYETVLGWKMSKRQVNQDKFVKLSQVENTTNNSKTKVF